MFPLSLVFSRSSAASLANRCFFSLILLLQTSLFAGHARSSVNASRNSTELGSQMDVSAFPSLPFAFKGAAAAEINGTIYVQGASNISGRTTGYLFRFSNQTKSWIEVESRLLPREHGSLIAADNKLYFIGGRNAAGPISEVEIYDLKAKRLLTGAAMPTPRYFTSAALYQGYIFVAGGTMGWGRMATVEIYHPSTDQWFRGEPLAEARDTQLAVVNGALLAFGGYTGKAVTRLIERLDPKSLEWKPYAKMPEATSAYSIVVVDNTVYTFGDFHELDRVLQFEPQGKRWTVIESNISPRRRTAAVPLDNEVLLIGGKTDTYLKTVEKVTLRKHL
jgi:N-acetylneuraminic acid mutarotase